MSAVSHSIGAGDWPAVRNVDNSGASALLGGRLTSPTLLAQCNIPNFVYPLVANVTGTPRAATETAWGQVRRPATQDFAGDGRQQTILCENSADHVLVKVVDAGDKKALWEQEISMKDRPGLFLDAPIIADVNPELPGDEAIFFGNWIDKPRKEEMKIKDEDGFFGYICCVSYSGGKGRIVWENEQMHITYCPGVAIDDVDGDGIKDIIVSVHYRLFIINGKTGQMTQNVFFSHGRNYGLVQTFQRKGDPFKKILISGDFYEETTIVDLFRQSNGTVGARALWTMLFDDTVGLRMVNTYSMPQMVEDLDGGGMPQLLLNFFNSKGHELKSTGGFENPYGDVSGDGICDGIHVIGKEPFYVKGDGIWHALVLDPQTGHVVQSVPGQWFDGAGDLNGDGLPELFMLATHGQLRPTYGPLSLWNQKGSKLQKVWTLPGKRNRIVKAQLGYRPFYYDNIVNHGIPLAADLDGDGRMEFFNLSDTDGDWNADKLECFSAERGGEKLAILSKWVYDAPHGVLEVSALSPAAGLKDVYELSVVDRRDCRMHRLDAATGKDKAAPTLWEETGTPWNPHPVAGDFDGDGKMELAVCDNSYETRVLKYQPGTKEFTEQIRLPGHGLNAKNPLVADLDGDGKSEFILAQPGKHGEIQIAAFAITGKKLWATPIEDINFSALGFNSPGSLDGCPVAADFNGDGVKDVFFSVFRDYYTSRESFALDGKNGHLFWRVRGLPGHDSSGGTAMLGTRDLVTHVALNGLKREDLVLCSTFFSQLVEGATGKLLSPLVQVDEAFSLDKSSCAYFSPIVADVDGDGQKDIYWFGGGRYHVLTDLTLKKKWDVTKQTVGVNGFTYDAVGRMHKQGAMDILFIGALAPPKNSGNVVWNEADNTRLICVDGATGTIAWTWRPENKENFNTVPVLVDVDGDLLHEALVIVGSDLYAVKAPDAGRGQPSVLWCYHLPKGYPNPCDIMVVDANGDGNPEILLSGALASNGKLWMIGDEAKP